jgi:hypothetical protein
MFSQVRISHVLRLISICDLFTDSLSYDSMITVSRTDSSTFIKKKKFLESGQVPRQNK